MPSFLLWVKKGKKIKRDIFRKLRMVYSDEGHHGGCKKSSLSCFLCDISTNSLDLPTKSPTQTKILI